MMNLNKAKFDRALFIFKEGKNNQFVFYCYSTQKLHPVTDNPNIKYKYL
jgi:hypothetical protein